MDKAAAVTSISHIPDDQGARKLRKSTQEASVGFKRRFEEEELMRRKRKKQTFHRKDRIMTQAELLEEAKWTEIKNLASLEAYTRMVEERKKVKLKKKVWTGPMVKYLSLTMPLLTQVVSGGESTNDGGDGVSQPSLSREENGGEEGEEKCQEQNKLSDCPVPMETDAGGDASGGTGGAGDKCAESVPITSLISSQSHHQSGSNKTAWQMETQKQSRNFLIFTDTNNFPSDYFPVGQPVKPNQRFCPITHLPAKYIDPLTHIPYATPFAFKVIRARFVNNVQEKCDRRLVQLSSWLEEKKKEKMESSWTHQACFLVCILWTLTSERSSMHM